MAILGTDDVGIFVNAGRFTKDAGDEEHYSKLDEAARRRLPLQPIYIPGAGRVNVLRESAIK